MKLYYHKTDGGAEYLCTRPVDGTQEGDLSFPSAVIRTDGGEIEIYVDRLKAQGIKLVIS
jgi:hypothetical protein